MTHREEKVGGARKSTEDHKAKGLGDCVDCNWCVQVCPVDIDIRDGLQYACIDCGLCVDACNNVMDKVGYPAGLIRFTSESALESGKSRIFRPLLAGYFSVFLAFTCLFAYGVSGVEPIGLDIARDRGGKLFHINNDVVENVYSIKINNKKRDSMRFRISINGQQNYQLSSTETSPIAEGETLVLPVRITLPKHEFIRRRERLEIVVHAVEAPELVAKQQVSFIGPGTFL